MAAKKKVKPNAVVREPLNLRSEPSLSGEKLCIMGAGEEIIVTELEDNTEWYAVKFMDVEGFAMSKFIDLKK